MTVLRMCELGQISRAGLYRFDPDQQRREEERKRQSNGIYAQASFGAEVESWWHREGSIAGTGAGRKRIS